MTLIAPRDARSVARALARAALDQPTTTALRATVDDRLPSGARPVRAAAVVGHGPADFELAREGLRTWRAHDAMGLGVVPSDALVEVGGTVLVTVGTPVCALAVPCRIVEVTDERDRFGFSYATLPGHPERGEERFEVVLGADGDVVLTIRAFSAHATWYARIAGPLARAAQDRATRGYLRALRAHIDGGHDRRAARSLALSMCRRPFSAPEALAFQWAVAPGLADVVTPLLTEHAALGRVLDVGCGGGIVAGRLADLGATVVGLDPSAAQLALTRRTTASGAVCVLRGRAEQLPFTGGAFDAVVSSCAWKHWDGPERGVAECLRVLRPGGRLCVVELDGASTSARFGAFASTTRLPRALRGAYVGVTMRTAVAAAPRLAELTGVLARSGGRLIEAGALGALPFLVGVVEKSST